jgi:predicted 2-oxoglutarate/Fe(II)-dependent dioxygenase YbiX
MTAPIFPVPGFPAPGDPAPFCYGLTGAGIFYSFQAQAGRPAALILTATPEAPDIERLVAAFAARLDAFAANEADVLLVVNQNPVVVCQRHLLQPSPLTTIAGNGDFFQLCGLDAGEPLVLVVDRGLRVIARFGPSDDVADAALAVTAAAPREAPRDIVAPAPVLTIPSLLSPELCRALVARHDEGGNFDSGFASADAEGKPHYKVDHGKKKRRDHLVGEDDPLLAPLREVLMRRCAAEIKKAFQVEIGHLDRLLVARYDDDGGCFRRHRDNSHESLAFRQFAISVNLNTEDYDGGHLLFPEYNSHRYRPATGMGVIFSASLLHEATPVLRGSRYVLLSFLHSEEAEQRRRAYLERNSPKATQALGAA